MARLLAWWKVNVTLAFGHDGKVGTAVFWGDLPSYLNLLMTGVALYFAYKAATASWEVVKQARTEASERAARERQAQAALVAAWRDRSTRDDLNPATGQPFPSHLVGAAVVNRSDLPVYNMECDFLTSGGVSVATVPIPIVPPGRLFVGTPPPGSLSQPLGDGHSVSIKFWDAGNVQWSRDEFGQLSGGTTVRARVRLSGSGQLTA